MSKRREQVHAWVHGNIGFIVFDMPPVNIMTLVTFKRISFILDDFEHEHAVKAVVFMGDNGNFCGGVNLKWMQTLQQSPEVGNETIDYFYKVALKIREFPKPTIAAVENGACCGVGFELAMLCDYIVASERNVSTIEFGALAVRYGFMLGLGTSWRLAQKIGMPNAARFLLKSETTDLATAHRLCIVDTVLPGENSIREVCRFVHELLEGNFIETFTPPFAPKVAKLTEGERESIAPGCPVQTVSFTLDVLEQCGSIRKFRRALALDKIWFKELFFSANAKEGISAFLEKRTPNFSK